MDSPLSLEALKFNVDGSSRGVSGTVGIGGVLRNSKGKVLCLFSAYVGFQDAISTEVLAIQKACSLCASSASLFGKETAIVSDS